MIVTDKLNAMLTLFTVSVFFFVHVLWYTKEEAIKILMFDYHMNSSTLK